MTEQAPTMRLGNEELFFLLRTLQAPGIYGLDTQAFEALASEVRLVALAAASHSLQARNMIDIQPDGKIIIDTYTLALIGTCSLAHSAVSIEKYAVGEHTRIGFYQTPELHVQYRNNAPLHEFQALENPSQVVEDQLQQLFGTSTHAPALLQAPISIDINQFQQARQAIIRELANSSQLLQQAGIPAAQMDILYTFLHEQTATIGVTTINSKLSTSKQLASNHMIVLKSPQHLLAITETKDHKGFIQELQPSTLIENLIHHFATQERGV